jgi:hypothetical protein
LRRARRLYANLDGGRLGHECRGQPNNDHSIAYSCGYQPVCEGPAPRTKAAAATVITTKPSNDHPAHSTVRLLVQGSEQSPAAGSQNLVCIPSTNIVLALTATWRGPRWCCHFRRLGLTRRRDLCRWLRFRAACGRPAASVRADARPVCRPRRRCAGQTTAGPREVAVSRRARRHGEPDQRSVPSVVQRSRVRPVRGLTKRASWR